MTTKFDKVLELIVLGGFLGLNFALMNWIVPEANAQHFGQALGAFTVIATLVAKSLWERGSATAIIDEKKVDNTGEAFKAITAVAATTPPTEPPPDATAAAEAVAGAAVEEAARIKGDD